MCGIVGAIAERNIVPVLVEGLRRLEYRGYDSAGVAVLEQNGQIGLRTPTHLYGMRLDGERREIADEGHCFYDLIADPYEECNLARTDYRPELAEACRKRLAEWHRETPWLGR